MNIQSEKPYMIFVKEYNSKKYYKVGLSKKLQDGNYENGYIDVQFKKGIDLENKTQIYFKNAFLTFYKTKDSKTIPYIMILDYELVSDVIDREHKEIKKDAEPSEDLFAEFGKELDEDNFELPF